MTYYIYGSESPTGPYYPADLLPMLRSGSLLPSDLVSTNCVDWVPVDQVPAISEVLHRSSAQRDAQLQKVIAPKLGNIGWRVLAVLAPLIAVIPALLWLGTEQHGRGIALLRWCGVGLVVNIVAFQLLR